MKKVANEQKAQHFNRKENIREKKSESQKHRRQQNVGIWLDYNRKHSLSDLRVQIGK